MIHSWIRVYELQYESVLSILLQLCWLPVSKGLFFTDHIGWHQELDVVFCLQFYQARYRSQRDVQGGLENLTRRSQRRWIEVRDLNWWALIKGHMHRKIIPASPNVLSSIWYCLMTIEGQWQTNRNKWQTRVYDMYSFEVMKTYPQHPQTVSNSPTCQGRRRLLWWRHCRFCGTARRGAELATGSRVQFNQWQAAA